MQEGKKRHIEKQKRKNRRKNEEEDRYLLGHHLFNLWFHVAVHCFSYLKTNTNKSKLSAVLIG